MPRTRFLGERSSTGGGRSRYLGGDTGGGSSFGHFVGRVGSLLAHAPAGVITYGVTAGKAVAKQATFQFDSDAIKDFNKLNKAIAVSTATTVRHPLRDPASTALLVPSLIGGGYGLASRTAAAGGALSRGATVGEAAGTLVRSAPMTPRIVNLRGEPVEIGVYSRGALKRDIQKGLDVIREQHPDRPILGRSLTAKVGFELARSRHYEEVLARVPGLELLHAQRKLSLPEHTALRVVAEGVPIETRLNVHRADLAKTTDASTRLLIRRQIRLLNLAKPLVEMRPTVRGGSLERGLHLTDPKLQSVYDTLKKTAKSREDLLDAFDLLGPGAKARVHAPGRVFLGATHVPETPGRLGVPSLRLKQHRAYVDRLQGLYDRAVVRRDKAAAKMVERMNAPAVVAKAGVAEIPHIEFDAALWTEGARIQRGGRTVARLNDDMTWTIWRDPRPGYGTRAMKGDTRISTAGAAKKMGADRDLVEAMNDAMQMMARSRTREGVSTPVKPLPLPKPAEPTAVTIGGRVVAPGKVITPPEGARAERLGAALSVAKDRLTQMEEAAARRIEPTGLIGAEEFAGGDVYVGYGGLKPGIGLVRVGEKVIGQPRKPASLRKGFTGAAIHAGAFRSEAAQVVAHAQFEAARYTMLLRIRPQLERFATATKMRDGQVPMRVDLIEGEPSMTPGARMLMQEAIDGKPLTELEKQGLGASYESLRGRIFPEAAEVEAAQIPGVVWIDEKLLGGMNKPNPATSIVARPAGKVFVGAFDIINNASRFAILYLKPAYLIPNLLGNIALNLIQQGFAAPVNLARAARVNTELTGKAVATLDGLIGEGASRAIQAQGGPLAGASERVSGFFNRVVDLGPRRASFFHEAGRAGYRTTREVEDLLTNPARREDLVRVAREANSEMVDFNRLGPYERELVRRVIFFYPWIKGSTVYGARMIGEHPGMFASMAAAGRLGEVVTQGLGPTPSYAEGIFPVGGERSPGVQMVAQPASASLLGSPADVMRTVAGLFSGNAPSAFQTAGFVTPAVGAGLSLSTGMSSFGEKIRGQSNMEAFLRGLYEGLPQYTLGERLVHPPSESTDRLYPYTRRDALLQFLIGGLAPRPYNVQIGQERAKEGR